MHRVSTVVFCNCTVFAWCQWRIQGGGSGGAMVRSLHLWSDREFLDNFWTVFINFVSWLNVKIRVSKLLVTVRVFAFKNCIEIHPNLSFWGQKMIFFLRRGPAPPPHFSPSTPPYWNPKYATAWCTLSIMLCYLLFVHFSLLFLLPLVVNKDVHKTVLSTIFGVYRKKIFGTVKCRWNIQGGPKITS